MDVTRIPTQLQKWNSDFFPNNILYDMIHPSDRSAEIFPILSAATTF